MTGPEERAGTGNPRGRLLGGRYRIDLPLGSGGMADVYEAYDERLDRQVAVKMLKATLAADHALTARFAAEARSAGRLGHPNVVAVYDTGEDGGVPWLVMERLPGRTLADVLAGGRVDQGRLRSWVLEALAAVGAAHRAGIVHRDIKPANILLTEDGHAKVADFGIAKSIEAEPGDLDLTSTGMLLGTPAYLAPERIDGSPATPQSDLFAIGVLLWEGLVGRKPFEGATPLAIAAKVQHETAPALGSLRPDADPRLAAAAEQAMAKDPAQRPASAEDMAAIITGAAPIAAPGAPTVAIAPSAPATVAMTAAPTRASDIRMPATPTPERNLLWPVVAAVAAFLVLLAIALLLIADRNKPPVVADSTTTELASTTTAQATSTTRRATTTTSANTALIQALRDEATRVESSGESPDVAARLRGIADTLQSGSSAAGDATGLRNDLPAYVNDGSLSSARAREVDSVLARVPGVGPPPPTTQKPTTTTAQPTTTTSNSPRTSVTIPVNGGGGGGGGG